ncbi:helix-turn-helix transcriptional regulator [Rhodoferax sp. GW822-FHT02A01]|uniref:helix-turn-helix domain-containing protein n=1 Tax=Rhodoferax sp. GW822-FHT02A01 TaxID=3141537 RepID=UPI00315DF4B7
MLIPELITAAKKTSGLKYNQMAEELHVTPSTFTAWKKGEYKPSPSEIAYLAEKAQLSVFETIAEIEAQQRPELAELWKRAVRQLRQNQG